MPLVGWGDIFGVMNLDFDRVAKLLPVGLAAIYVVGFLVVALHLATYGASPLELFKVQYLAAGFWCGMAFVAYYGLTLPVRSGLYLGVAEQGVRHFWQRGFLARLVPSLIVNGMFLGFALWVAYLFRRLPRLFEALRGAGSPGEVLGLREASWLPLVALLAAFSIVLEVHLSLKEESKEPREYQRWRRYFSQWAAIFAVMLFFSCVISFSRDVYPKIPFSLGGGHPRSVLFRLSQGVSQADSFLVRDGDGPYTIPYELLLENEGSLVVVSPKDGERAIEFDRKAVTAVIVLGKSSRGPSSH